MSTATQQPILSGGFPTGHILWKWSVNTFDDLSTITDQKDGDIARVVNSQGTKWLPGSLGGSYYPSGFYTWDEASATWKADNSITEIAEALHSIGGGGGNLPDSWSINGILSTTSSTFGQVPEQIMIPHKEQISAGSTKIEAKLLVSTICDAGATGEADVFDYTDGTQIAGSVVAFSNTVWNDNISSAWFDVTAYEGKAIRPRIRRLTGQGQDVVQIEGAALIYRIS